MHQKLFACAGDRPSNAGRLGPGGEVLSYTPFLATPAGPVARTPTDAACLSSGFGLRARATGGGRQHKGIDLAPRGGKRVFAAAAGVVTKTDIQAGYGLVVRIDHGSGVETRYAHLDPANPTILTGVRVAAGQPIGVMGQTGNATGVHLHYEVRINGAAINPLR